MILYDLFHNYSSKCIFRSSATRVFDRVFCVSYTIKVLDSYNTEDKALTKNQTYPEGLSS